MSGWRGVGAELHALRDEMHDERWRAYAEHLRVVSELWPRRAAEFEAVWEDQDQVIADALTRLNDERWRAYNRELVLWSELARMREAWRAALVPRVVVQDPEPVMQPERARALELYSIAALDEEEVAKMHGLGPKGAMR